MIPRTTACHVRRTFADVENDIESASVTLTRVIDAVVLPVSTPRRPTECGWKCISLPSILPRDGVVIDSCGGDGTSL